MLLTVILLIVGVNMVECDRSTWTAYLPPDADFITVIGDGFKLQVSQLDNMKSKWGDIARDSQQVEEPNRDLREKGYVREIKTKDVLEDREMPLMSPEFHDWVKIRAKALAGKIERYERQIPSLKERQRIVAQILLLNTQLALEMLTDENIKTLKWIKKKLRALEMNKNSHINDVENWVRDRIKENQKIEKSVKGTNNPGHKWLSNTQAVKRILLEQRFSEQIRQMVAEYLAGKFGMMERSRVYDIFKHDQKVDDELYYEGSRGRVPSHFPFSAQDAIINEA